MRALRWDIFCRVVDNFGDAGVCWRLARQLVGEHRAVVRLWIDDLQILGRLHPGIAAVDRQTIEGVEVARWDEGVSPVPAEIVIEAFGCGLPENYPDAMAQAARKSVWIVLEYLSAEAWVPRHHELPSPHPRLSLDRYYFFPGFTQGTGGLLREADLFARRDRFDAARRDAFWRAHGHEPPAEDSTTVSVFAYENAPLPELLRCWEKGASMTIAAIPEGHALAIACRFLGVDVSAQRVARRGSLEVRALPFLPLARYDELLWSCACNFVRGEDSFARALWAALPFVWQIYPQEDGAHRRKLEAFLSLYEEGLPTAAREAASGLMRAWNQIETAGVTPASAWEEFMRSRDALRAHGLRWAERIAATGTLADKLAHFAESKLK